ncbi:MAG: hypothetical protein LIP18_01480 [Planctomycetes bacterium]|nr:hypothetical protein [Planctomycetota bacterium]
MSIRTRTKVRTLRSFLWPAAVALVLLVLAVVVFERRIGLQSLHTAGRIGTGQAEDRGRTALARAADIARTTSRGIGIIVENADDPAPFIRDILAAIPGSLPGIDRAWLVVEDENITVGTHASRSTARSDPLLALPLFMGVPYFEPSRRTGGDGSETCTGLGAISYPIIADGAVAGVFGLDIDYAEIIPNFRSTVSGTAPYLLSDNGDVLLPACPPAGERSLFEKYPGEDARRTLADLLALRRTVTNTLPAGPGGRSTRVSLSPATPAGFGRTVYVYTESPVAPVPDGIDHRLAGIVLVGLVVLLGLIMYYQSLYRGLPGSTSESGRFTVGQAESPVDAPLPKDIGLFTAKPPEAAPANRPVTRIRPRTAPTLDTATGADTASPRSSSAPASVSSPVAAVVQSGTSTGNSSGGTGDSDAKSAAATCDVEIRDGEPLAKLALEETSLDLAAGLGNVQCQKDVYEEMLRIAAGSIPHTVEALMSAYANEDYERMGVEAHRGGASSELVGFAELAGEAFVLEQACRESDLESIEGRLTGFLESLNRTRKTIERSFDFPSPLPGEPDVPR